jgi:hypothetical protein
LTDQAIRRAENVLGERNKRIIPATQFPARDLLTTPADSGPFEGHYLVSSPDSEITV